MGSKVTTTHSCLCFMLIFAQCFGMLPIRGITNESWTVVKFQWTSKRTLYSVLFAAAATVNTFFFIMKMIREGNTQFTNWVTLLFYTITVITVITLINVARKWPCLIKKWTEVDSAMSSYGFPVTLHRKLKVITVVVMSAAVVEHCLFVAHEFVSCGEGQNFIDTVHRYFKYRFDYVFAVVTYHIWWGIFLEILNILSTLSWNFMDLFIILVSLCLSTRFKHVAKNTHYLASRNVENEYLWEKVRVDYTRLTVLCDAVDDVISSTVLLSFGNNIFVILVQLFNTLNAPPILGVLDRMYYIYSFGFLIVRIIAVSLYAATINFESKKPRVYLNMLSHLVYNEEIDRFLHQTKYHTAALTGHKLFRVTRGFIFEITLAIVSYELVLARFLTQGLH